MRRRLVLTVMLCLLIGFMTTVAIAWGAVLRSSGNGPWLFASSGAPSAPKLWMHDVPASWPDKPFGTATTSPGGRIDLNTRAFRLGSTIRRRQGMANGVGGNRSVTVFSHDDPRYVIEIYEAGWPWMTLERRGSDDARVPAASWLGRLLESGVPIGPAKALPLIPMWPAFWLSTLMWAGGAGLVAIAIHMLAVARRRRRKKRGQCTNCGYDLTGLIDCPECGTKSHKTIQEAEA